MVDLNPIESKILEAMKALGASNEEKMKDADAIAKKALLPKGQVNNALLSLENKRMIKRVVRHKSAGYFTV